MGGLFDDIFDDSDFEIGPELEEELEVQSDDWNDGPDSQRGATWDTGNTPDIWNADEPWTTSDGDCDSDCDPTSECGGCQDKSDNDFKVDDFFS